MKLNIRITILTSFLLMGILCFSAQAKNKGPKLTFKVQRALYSAQQAMDKKDYSKAEKDLLKFMEKHPQDNHYLLEFTLANVFAFQGKDKEASSHYQEAIKLYPDYAPSWQNLGKVYFDLKQYQSAGKCFLKGYELSEKKDLSLIYWASCAYIMAKKEEKALPYLEKLISNAKEPPKTEWLEALLNVYINLGLKEKALKVVYQLLQKEEGKPIWWKFLANIHLQQNEYEKALCALTVYSYLTPLKKDEKMLLADLNNMVGLPLQAARYYEDIIAPGSKPSYYRKLAMAYILGHRLNKAENILKEALKENQNAKLWFMLAELFYEEERFDEAYNAFKQSASLNPQDGRAFLMMGYCAIENGKKTEARKAFQKAYRFPKQRKVAEKLLKQIALFSDDETLAE